MTLQHRSSTHKQILKLQDEARNAPFALDAVGRMVTAHTAFGAQSLSGLGREFVQQGKNFYIHELALSNDTAFHIIVVPGKEKFVALATVMDVYRNSMPNGVGLDVFGDIIGKKRILHSLPTEHDACIVWRNDELLDAKDIVGFRVLAAEYDYAAASMRSKENDGHQPVVLVIESLAGVVYDVAIADTKSWLKEQGQ